MFTAETIDETFSGSFFYTKSCDNALVFIVVYNVSGAAFQPEAKAHTHGIIKGRAV